MKFAILTHVIHKNKNSSIYAYEPYVREMNLWSKYVSEVIILAPFSGEEVIVTETKYKHPKIKIEKTPKFNLTSIGNFLKSLFVIPIIIWRLFKVMKQADHIHLRCPGNIGLLACFVQIFFPNKSKTVKYAGNWDPKSKQPLSYKLQKWILSNTFLTRNCKVLVYGKWKNQSKNIIPFFTASYSDKDIINKEEKSLANRINLIFVGTFSEGKQPMKSVLVAENLLKKGYNIELNMYGNGKEFHKIKTYIDKNNLNKNINLHGNQSKEVVKKAYQKSHFLVFISKSEGWPKVVAEAMFWSCLPISTKVSCVPFMLNYGKRGAIVNDNINEIVKTVESYINNINSYQEAVSNAKNWSQNYTLEKFQLEIGKLL